MKLRHCRLFAAVCSVVCVSSFSAQAVTFSIDLPSPFPGFGDDLFNEGPVPAMPGAGPGIEVDAMSYGRSSFVPEFYFSVDSFSTGVPAAPGTNAVTDEAVVGNHYADIFVSTGGGFNLQYKDGDGIIANPLTPGAPGVFPPLGLFEPGAGGDNTDALDLRSIGPMIYWSVDAATAGGVGVYAGTSAADIFMAPTGPGYSGFGGGALYAPAALIGLLAGLDDIDALVYIEDAIPGPSPGDTILFSLTPGSATLGILGASPADILITSPGAALPGVFVPAAALGLSFTDNIDALDVVPEPSQSLLLGGALVCLALRRRRRA